MIIVEGTDKAGKTTFLGNVITRLKQKQIKNTNLVHFGLLPSYWDYCNDYLKYVKPDNILDRFVDSELAYGPIYRNGINNKLTNISLNRVYRACSQIGCLVLYCNPNVDVVKQRFLDQGDQVVRNIEEIELLRNNFDNILFSKKYPLELEVVDTSSTISQEKIDNIINKSLVLSRSAKVLDDLNYHGYYTPWSEYVIYTNQIDLIDNIHIIIDDVCNEKISRFAIIASRNNNNNPVNINNLLYALPSYKQIFVLGKESIKDYNKANNTTNHVTFCETYKEFTYNIGRINT